MVKVGDSIMFNGGGKETVCEINSILMDGQFILVVDQKNALLPKVAYNMSVTKPDGLIVGGGILAKIGEKRGVKSGKNIEYIVRITRPFKKVQSRNAYRLDTNLPVELNVFTNKNFKNPIKHSAVIKNLSAGGAKLLADVSLEKNSIVNIYMKLGADSLDVFGAVIDSVKNEDAQIHLQYVIRVRFTRIPQGDCELILKYIFEEFRKERRKQIQQEKKSKEESEGK